jgi:hypothetical protein
MFEKPTKTELTRMMQDICGECDSRMFRWKSFADKLDGITDAELTAMGYSSTEIAYIRSAGVALKNIELRYRNQAPANSDDPSYFIRYMTRMLTI